MTAREEDEPSVMGAGCGLSAPPTRDEAETVWRRAFAARLMERGLLDQAAADACAAASEVDLSENPSDAADEEITYWDGE